MRRPFFLSLLVVLVLVSCSTSRDERVITSLLSVKPTREETFLSTQEAYRRFPQDRRVLYNYAYMLASDKRFDEAIDVIDEALALEPTSLRFHYLKASILYESGRHRSYIAQLEGVLSFDPADTDASLALATYAQSHFMDEEAVAYAHQVLTYDSDNAQAISILALHDDYFASIGKPLSEQPVARHWLYGSDVRMPYGDEYGQTSYVLADGTGVQTWPDSVTLPDKTLQDVLSFLTNP